MQRHAALSVHEDLKIEVSELQLGGTHVSSLFEEGL